MMAVLAEGDGTFSVVEKESGFGTRDGAWLVIRRRLASGMTSAVEAKQASEALARQHGPLLDGVWSATGEATARLSGPLPRANI